MSAELQKRLTPITWEVAGIPDVTICAVQQRDKSVKYAVRRYASVLAKDGQWEYEPQPSSRDDEFIARCRYSTIHEALTVLDRAS